MTTLQRTLSLLLLATAALRAEAQIACAPSKPVALVGETIRLSAWTQEGAAKDQKWSSDTGKLSANGGGALWKLEGAEVGPATAELSPSGAAPACEVTIRVVATLESGSRGERPSGQTLLGPEKESAGYGLYSYVLFGSRPEGNDRARYQQILQAVADLMPSLDQLRQSLPPAELNAVMVPVNRKPPAKVDTTWILENYDWARATALLSRAPVPNRTGLYIVSSRAPLLEKPNQPEYLVQNLSSLPPSLASTWVDAFLNQAAQQNFSKPQAATQLVLKLRLALSALSVGVPQVKQAVASWVELKH
jgi:hypothetical protein